MKKLVRKVTGLFLGAGGEWVADVRHGVDFMGDHHASGAVPREERQGCEVYYWFGEEAATEYDFTTPLW